MGKKTTKRKTRWRTLSIGEVPSDTEEENHENHYYNRTSSKFRGYNNTDNLSEHSSGGGGGSGSGSRPPYHRYNSHPYSTTSSQSSSTTTTNQRTANATQSSHSTPIRNRYRNNNSYGGYGEKYKSSRSNSTASEPKITFNEDEYTRITTPRQDVLFKKGYLSKKKPTVVNNIDNSSSAQINGGSISSSSNDGQANATTNGGSCGESNPSTGYNSTTGGGTPEHHSLDGGDYYDTDLEQPQQFIFHNGFVDQHGVFYVNGYDPYSVMLIGPPAPPPGQFIHPVDFYPPPSAGVPCYPQIVPSTVFNPVDSAASISSKACSTDSQTESNSPHNEIESGDTNFASSEQSQCSSSVSNNVDNESENDVKKEPESLTNQLLEHSSESDKKLVVNGERSEDERLATEAETPTPVADGDIIGTTNDNDQLPSKSQDISSNNSKDEQPKVIKHGDVTTTTIQSSNNGLLEHNFIPTAAAIFHPHHQAAAPAHFFVAPSAGFISFAPPPPLSAPHHHTPHHPSHGQNIYINDTNMQSTRVLNNTETVDTNRQRYIQKRRRRKLSRSQNEIENKYSDHSDSTGEEFEDENRKKSPSQLQMSNQIVKHQENSNVMIEKSKKLQTNSSNIETDVCVSNDEQISIPSSNEKSETQDNTNETKEINSQDKSRQNELPVSPVKTNSVSTIVAEGKKSNAEENTTNIESHCQNGGEETLGKINDTISKENKTTVYKVDAEEFIPRSMRQQTPVTDTEKIINPELRAKFENYLNRQDLPDFPVHNFVPNSDFVYAIPTSSAHTAEIYINPLDGISDHVTNSISFPSHNKFISHQQFASRKQHSFGNNYNNKKKQKYSKPNYYYRKSNSVEASTSTQDEEFNGEIDSPQTTVSNKTNERLQMKMNNQPTEEKNNSNTQEVTNVNTIKKTEQNGEIDKSTELVSPTKENKETVGETKNNTISILPEEKVEPKEKGKDEKSILISKNSNPVSEESKETITPPLIPLTNDKPKNITRNREISKRSPAKINKSSIKISEKPMPPINNITTVPKNTKNYAQILQKVDNDKKNQKITKLDIAKASINSGTKTNVIAPKSAEPVHKSCPKLINGSKSLPTTPDESEWISVSSRKKSKNKYHNQNVSTSLHENYLIQETVEEAIKVEIKPEVKKPVVEEILKMKDVKETMHLKKDSLEENNSQKVSLTPVAPVHSNKTSPSIKNKNKNTTKQKREPSVKKTSKFNETKTEKHLEKPKTVSNDNENSSNNSAKLKDEVNNQEKVRKTRSKSLKKTPQKENPVHNYSNTAIIESIDNLRKMANEHSKTNLEISQEMDRIIQQGLYKNLGEKIRSLDQDEKFLSVLDTTKLDILPRLLFESKFQSNDSVPEFNIMETLTECQKLFAYKSVKDANDIKDIKHTNIIAKSRENSISKEMPGESKNIENINDSVQVKKIDNFTISDKSYNLSASSVNEDESVKTDTVEITTTTNDSDLNFSNNETKSDIKSTEIIDEIDFKNVPSTSGLQNNDADLSDNDETLISFKFDSNENISVITEEPRASIPNDFAEPLSEYNDDGDVSKHSPDPDSWSSHTNMTTTTEAHSVTTSSEFTAKLSSSHKSLTEVVKEWLHEAKEKTPDLDVLKSPDKLYREKSAPPKLYRQYSSTSLSASSGDESEPEVGTNQSKNVKGNPLFAASVKSNHSFLSLMGETLLEPIAKSGYTSSMPGAAIGEDALLVNRRVASNSDTDHVHIEEEYNTTTVEDFKTIATRRIKENVAVLAREFVNTVNPVVDGVNISENERLDEFKINTNYCCEVNEHTDLSNENNLRDECCIARTNRKVINITNNNANDNNNGTNFMIRGAFVRDVGVIKRAVSENGAIFNNIVNNVPNINYNEDVNKNVNKSKSCVDMKLLFVKENGKRNDNSKHTLSSTTTSTSSSSSTVYTTSRHLMASREGSQESNKHNNIEMGSMDDLLECWDHDLLNNEKPVINVHNKNDARICIKNNLTNSSNDMTEVSKKKELNTDIANRKETGEHDNDDEIIEHYESMYGKNFDFLEIRQKVLNECEQQRVMNGIIANEPPCVAGRGAVCCSVM